MNGSLQDAVSALDDMKIDALREAWRRYLASEPPKLRAADLLRRLLAEKLQEQALGCDLELQQQLAVLVQGYFRGERIKSGRATFRPGTILQRDYDGQRYVVEALDQGFRYNGQIWANLSQIAREITGTRWNGPRFFGLRDLSPG